LLVRVTVLIGLFVFSSLLLHRLLLTLQENLEVERSSRSVQRAVAAFTKELLDLDEGAVQRALDRLVEEVPVAMACVRRNRGSGREVRGARVASDCRPAH
jgi:hypothetical protein